MKFVLKTGLIVLIVFIILAVGWRWWRERYRDSDATLDQSILTSSPPQSSLQPIVPAPLAPEGEVVAQEPVPYQIEEFVRDLEVPWSMAWTSPERMLVTERDGRLRVIQQGRLVEVPLKTFEVSTRSEEGLMGLTLHPQYAQNQWVYLVYAYEKDSELVDKVVRFKDNGTTLDEETVIIDDIPAAQFHAGARLRFGPDGKLYITTGDATERQQAQNQKSLAGKILRLNDDGSVPTDNPIPGSPLWSWGHRNPQGLDWHPLTGTLYETEHGPSGNDGPGGGDEVNVIVKGQNYGWPLVSHLSNKPGLVAPKIVFTPAVAPASGVFYRSTVLPQFTNHFFFGALKGEALYHVQLSTTDPTTVLQYEKLPDLNVGRIRDVAEGPDGLLYFTTSNRDDRGRVREGDDKIYRLVKVE